MKINSKIHGVVDYLAVLFLWLSPTIFGLGPTTSVFAYGLGIIHFALTIFTHYEFGLIRFIHLKIHGAIELAASLILVGVAFYLGNIEGELSRNYFLGFAIVLFVLWLLSDYHNKPEASREIPYVESSTDGGMI